MGNTATQLDKGATVGMKNRCRFHHGRTNNILPWTTPPHSHAVHTSTTTSTHSRLATSAVRYTAPNYPPNPLALKQTTSLLAPAYRSWSPCLGAALSCSPLIGNLLRVPTSNDGRMLSSSHQSSGSSRDFQHASQLASLIYFQLIRESPLHVTRTQSLPAAYLNPSLIGSLLGLSFPTNQASSSKSLINYFKQAHGIKSNYIDKTYWTGISMQRWKDLLMLPPDTKGQPLTIASEYPLVSAVWLVALWNTLGASSSLTQSASAPISATKQHLWEFLASADQAVRQGSPSHPGILDPNNPLAQAILHDAGARDEWLTQEFTIEDLSDDALEQAWDVLLQQSSGVEDTRQDWADALDRVCAALVLEQYPTHAKPACPNGYYAPEPAKDSDPDVPIMLTADCAEVMAREIMDVLVWDEERGCRDATRLPSTASPALRQLVQPTATGNDWFQALYDLPDCQYLAETPKGQPYELAPILSNILRALQHHWEGPPASRDTAPWDTLEDFAAGVSSPTTSLLVQQQTLTHRSASTGNLIHHEVGVLRRADASWGIEVRLRCDWDNLSGMAAVTHMQEPQRAIMPGSTNRLSLPWDRFVDCHPAALLLGLATTAKTSKKATRVDDEPTASTLVRLLTTPYGVDRRPLAVSPSHDDTSWLQDYQEASETALTVAIEQVCQWACGQEVDVSTNNINAAAALTAWILDETPTVVEGMTHSQQATGKSMFQQRVETAIQSLPRSVLADPSVQQAIHWNWACRGKPLAAWAQWHCGQVSTLRALGRLSLADMAVFGTFCQLSR